MVLNEPLIILYAITPSFEMAVHKERLFDRLNVLLTEHFVPFLDQP
jgi:hypothetical protein